MGAGPSCIEEIIEEELGHSEDPDKEPSESNSKDNQPCNKGESHAPNERLEPGPPSDNRGCGDDNEFSNDSEDNLTNQTIMLHSKFAKDLWTSSLV